LRGGRIKVGVKCPPHPNPLPPGERGLVNIGV